ncbi:MAG: AAA family ATPase [Labilithrix sp.]|nr:AAA family ATPase [Labilithrix sp.]
MRISALELLAYGPFRGVALDFSAPGLHVVLGRNEAGKSTTLRAIAGLLYGIDAKTPDAHVHRFGDLRIGGVLEDAAGERVRVIRRKGNTNTLLDAREQPLDEGVMKKLLAGVTKETFAHAFGLDHGTLEAGAKALLEGRGDLGESLFDASVGGGGEVQRLLSELTAEADRLFKPRGSALPLNDALKSFAEAQKAIREKESRPEAFLDQERGLAEAFAAREARVKERADLADRRARLERAKRRLPLERRRQRAVERRGAGVLAGEHARKHAAQLGALKDRFAAYKHAREQARASLADVERLAERVAEAARRAGLDAGVDAERLRLDARKEERVNALLRDRTRLLGALESSRVEIAKQERELARLVAGAAGDPRSIEADADSAELAAALERARNLGDAESRLATRRAQVDRKRRDLEAKARSGGLFDGTLEAFIALRLPSAASVEGLEARAAAAAQALARLNERSATLEDEAAAIERQIAGQSGDFAPPDVAALATARSARDEAWAAVRAADASARGRAEVELERLLREADAVADRMIREADRVTTLARLRSEAETNERQAERLAAERERTTAERAALGDELAALFAEARITPPRPAAFAEMSAWLDRHAQTSADFASLREAEDEITSEGQKIDGARRDLLRALAAVSDAGVAPSAPVGDASGSPSALGAAPGDASGAPSSLAALITVGARRLAALESARREAAEAARAVLKVRGDLDERVASRERDEAALAEVATKLTPLIAPLGVSTDASAEEVARAIEAIRELFAVADKRADAEARARGLDAGARELEADLTRALRELAPDLAELEPRDAAHALFARGAEALVVVADLERVARELEAEGEASPVDEDDARLAADPDAAARALDELTDRIDEADLDVTRLTERIGGVRKGLEEMRGESHAAEAAAAAQQKLARVRETAERWCRVKLAAVLLSREIERYRQENQGPLLTSSSALFARLTLGAFSGIKAGFDDKDRPCLRCVRADGVTEVDVPGLSDGTRDQLYLSLRLASLLRRAEVAEPMPLVLDDVLIQLDDQRAAAALGVLAEVSRKMQVLFFTHHARLVDLARASVPAGDLSVHELVSGPYAAPPLAAAPS